MTQAEQDRLRVGVAGCGYQGGNLVQAIARLNAMTVVACADPDMERATSLAARAGNANPFSSVGDMLAGAEMDAVMVATPHHLLAEASLQVAQAGLHVMAEKPVAMNAAELAAVEKAVAEAGVCYMAGYSFRYLTAWQQVHDLLAAGAVGEIVAVSGSFAIGPLDSGWKSIPSTGGGPLYYVGSHLIDQVLWYVQDDPVDLYANARYRADTQADETTAIELCFARGATAQLMVTQTCNGFLHNVDIYGRDGFIGLRGQRSATSLDYGITVASRALPQYHTPTVMRTTMSNADARILMHLPQLEEFAAAIREHRQPVMDIRTGRRVLQVIDGIFASDRSGQAVSIG